MTPPRVGATGRSPLLEACNDKILLPLLPFHHGRLARCREVIDLIGLGELFPQRRHREGSARREARAEPYGSTTESKSLLRSDTSVSTVRPGARV